MHAGVYTCWVLCPAGRRSGQVSLCPDRSDSGGGDTRPSPSRGQMGDVRGQLPPPRLRRSIPLRSFDRLSTDLSVQVNSRLVFAEPTSSEESAVATFSNGLGHQGSRATDGTPGETRTPNLLIGNRCRFRLEIVARTGVCCQRREQTPRQGCSRGGGLLSHAMHGFIEAAAHASCGYATDGGRIGARALDIESLMSRCVAD